LYLNFGFKITSHHFAMDIHGSPIAENVQTDNSIEVEQD
jgi:hypothetical protein